MTTKITKRVTTYPDKTVTEFAFSSLDMAQYEFDRAKIYYNISTIEPIKQKQGKYWLKIITPTWWAGKNNGK